MWPPPRMTVTTRIITFLGLGIPTNNQQQKHWNCTTVLMKSTLRIMGSEDWWFGDPRTLLYRVDFEDSGVLNSSSFSRKIHFPWRLWSLPHSTELFILVGWLVGSLVGWWGKVADCTGCVCQKIKESKQQNIGVYRVVKSEIRQPTIPCIFHVGRWLRGVFAAADKDGSMTLERAEYRELLKSLGGVKLFPRDPYCRRGPPALVVR